MSYITVNSLSAGSHRVDIPDRSVVNRRLLSLTWAHFLNDGAANYLPGVLPAVLVALHINLALVGSLTAAILVCQGMQPLFGWAADRLGGRLFVIGGLTLVTIAGACVGLVPSYWTLIAVLLVIGTANASFHPQALACVRHSTTHHFALAMSIFLVGGELGRAIWPLIASLVVSRFGLSALWILALPALITLPFLGKGCPRAEKLDKLRCVTRHKVDRDRILPMAALVTYCALHATLVYSLSTFLPFLWKENGGTLVGGASVVTFILTVGNIGNLMGGYLADRFGRRRLIWVAGLSCAFFLSAFLVASEHIRWFFLVGLALAAFSTMPVRVLIAQDILPHHQSLGSGLALGFANGLGALIVVGLGPVAQRWGIASALWLNVGLTALSLLAIPLIPKASLGDGDASVTGIDRESSIHLPEDKSKADIANLEQNCDKGQSALNHGS